MWRRLTRTSTTLELPEEQPASIDAALSWYLHSPPSFLSSAPAGVEEIIDAIAQLRGLGADWDGYGALPVAEQALHEAEQLAMATSLITREIGVPEVSPNSNGTVSFEWETPRGDAYAEVGNTEASAFVRGRLTPTYYLSGSPTDLSLTLPTMLRALLAEQWHAMVGSSTQLQDTERPDEFAATGS